MSPEMAPLPVALMQRILVIFTATALAVARGRAAVPDGNPGFPEPQRINNLAALLLDIVPASTAEAFQFVRASDGWIFLSFTTHGEGKIRLTLDKASPGEVPINPAPGSGPTHEAMHYITRGRHTLGIERTGTITLEHLTLKAIPELMHCGLGFDPQIKSYGPYDLDFLKRDILPNVTTLIVPNNIKLSDSVIEDWHRQGKRFIAEVGINSQAKTAEEHAAYWTSFIRPAPLSSMGSLSTSLSSTGLFQNGSKP